MSRNEIDARVRLVFRLCGVVKNDVGPFLQVFLKKRIIDLPNHDGRRALKPDHLFELAASHHAIENALHMTDRSRQRHALADEKVERQVIETSMTRPGLYPNVLQRDADELDRLTHAESTTLSFFGEVQFVPIVAQQLADRDVSWQIATSVATGSVDA